MGSRVKPGIIQKRILERGKYFQFTGLDDRDAVQIVNISGTYPLSMECRPMLLSARTGNAYYTQLFNKWQFYPLPCTVWTWTLDNVHTFFCDILRAILKLWVVLVIQNSLTGAVDNMERFRHSCGPFSFWAVLIIFQP